MFEIKQATEADYEAIKEFLLEVPAIDTVEVDIIKNASVLYLQDKIYGLISYEIFFNYALIRYFVFKRNTDEMVVKELFESIEDKIIDNNIEYIFSLVNQNEIYDLFTSFDFNEINKDDIFIEEGKYSFSKFKDTKLMIKKLSLA